MMPLHLKKRKKRERESLFLTKVRPQLDLFEHRFSNPCDAHKRYMWEPEDPRLFLAASHTHLQAHGLLCFPSMCSEVNWGANWNRGIDPCSKEIGASCDRWLILAHSFSFPLIEVYSYFVIITTDLIKRLECLKGAGLGIDGGGALSFDIRGGVCSHMDESKRD